MCKALEDLVRDSIAEGRTEGIEKTLYSLRKEGYITTETAAEKMNISVEEYLEKENKYFKAIG